MELELSEFQKAVVNLVQETHVPGKHSARSAIFHIQKAWQIREIDPGMAVFRAITGEEESSTAIFHALKRHGYPGAKLLKPYNHFQKSAVTIFLRAVGQELDSLAKAASFEPKIEVREKKNKIRILVRITVTGPDNQKKYGYPEPPLNWKLEMNGRLHEFKEQIEKIVTEKNVKDIIKYINDLANKRNTILYASSQGVPQIYGNIENYLKRKRDEIFTNLTVFLMIDPYEEKQLLVEQVLKSFLKTLKLMPKHSMTESL